MRDVKEMSKVSLGKYWKYTLKYVCPVLLTSFIVANLIRYAKKSTLTYTAWNSSSGTQVSVPYPTWAYFLFILTSVFCLAAIPAGALLAKFGKLKSSRHTDDKEGFYTSKEMEVFA